ncbi:MAG: hypothetical protein AB8B48_10755 [Pseudomonadales bacterium]
MPTDNPRDFEQWLQSIASLNPAFAFSEETGQLLRVTASLADFGVLLCSGISALSYVPWLRDGMTMNSRLVIHLPPQANDAQELLTQQTQTDIRVAGHIQNTAEFLDDISHHRMNLLLLELSDDSAESLPQWQAILADNGLLVLLGEQSQLHDVQKSHAGQFFFASPPSSSSDPGVLLMSPKGLQHKTSRRGGRSRSKRRL